MVSDTPYDSDAFRADIVAQGGLAVIRPRKNRLEDRPYDEEVYKRHYIDLIEMCPIRPRSEV